MPLPPTSPIPRPRLPWREALLLLLPAILALVATVPRWSASRWLLGINPLLAGQRDQRASCQGNLRSLGLAVAQYSLDYDGRYPRRGGVLFDGWTTRLSPYLNDTRVFSCPTEAQGLTNGLVPIGHTDYWMNSRVFDATGGGISLHLILQPDRSLLMGDGIANSAPTYALNERTWQRDADYSRRHLAGANYLFADGHVAWLEPDAIFDGLGRKPQQSPYSFFIR